MHAANNAPMKEVLLTPTQAQLEYRPLQVGDFIQLGDLFQRKAGLQKMVEGTYRFVFETVDADSKVGSTVIAGLLYLDSYPVVLRPLIRSSGEWPDLSQTDRKLAPSA